jgi:DNA-binding winged helix-turn-helix (wHTH) protein/TolB-like protein
MKTTRTISFDGWVLRAETGELSKGAKKIRLQQRPLLVLEELLSHPGELVTREQLIARLWPKGVVDFDTGLNTAVSKLRVALDDGAEVPRYIETLPRKGYRFVGTIDPPTADEAPVPVVTSAAVGGPTRAGADVIPQTPPPEPMPLPAVAATAAPEAPVPMRRRWPLYAGAGVVLLLVVGSLFFYVRRGTATSSANSVVVSRPHPEDLAIAVLPLEAATSAESDRGVADVVSDAFRLRIGKLENMTVIRAPATPGSTTSAADWRKFAADVHARYRLSGKVATQQDQVEVRLELFDSRSGARIWSFNDTAAMREAALLVDKAARGVAGQLNVRADAVGEPATPAAINFQAYEIYLRAQQLMQTQRVSDAESALELYRRATVLDSGFARAYLGVAQALIFQTGTLGMDASETQRIQAEAMTACDHALTLDPGLGECLIERARLTYDSAAADTLFRKGLALAPNYGVGYQRYSEFLFDEYRRGEAVEAIERAHEIDPLEPRVALRLAAFRYYIDSDVSAHDRLAKEVLARNPRMVGALQQLSMSNWYNNAEFAESIRLDEQAVQLDPDLDDPKLDLADMYLEVGDPDASLAVLKLSSKPWKYPLVDIALFRRDPRRAAQLVREVSDEDWRTKWAAPEAWALRDDAMRTGDFTYALERMDKRFALNVPWGSQKNVGPRYWNRTLGLVYAHTLVLAGQTQQGRKLAQTILAQLDSESVGRARYYNSRDQAAAFMILGDKEGALRELKNSLSIHHYNYWWYTGDIDPLYAQLRPDPRFQALVTQAKEHSARQRALLDEMRRAGKVPSR